MIDNHQTFKELLESTGSTVIYEHFIDTTNAIPLISYLEINNSEIVNAITDTSYISYSTITYQVKIFTKSVSEMQILVNKIDKVLKKNRYKRTGCFETTDNNLIMKVLKYTITIDEIESF